MIGARRLVLVAANLALAGAVGLAIADDGLPIGGDVTASVSMRKAVEAGEQAPAQPVVEARPLFRIRPPAPPPEPPPLSEVAPSAPNFRLAGVVWSETEKVAIVQMIEDGRHQRARIGEMIGDWTLRDLTVRSAVFGVGSNRAELTLKPQSRVE